MPHQRVDAGPVTDIQHAVRPALRPRRLQRTVDVTGPASMAPRALARSPTHGATRTTWGRQAEIGGRAGRRHPEGMSTARSRR
jgi:hypothetical protein